MLVDLARNDLSRSVPSGKRRSRFLDGHQTVQPYHAHLVNRYRAGRSAYDGVRRVHFRLPAGTLSGAPKPRAIEIIDELEPPTVVFTAAPSVILIFQATSIWPSPFELHSFATMKQSVQAGAGIVLDSVPASEWQETRNKAEASVEAVQIAAQLRQL